MPTSPSVDTAPRTARPDEGDHDRFAHYVPANELNRALVEGTAVTALCGKRWVPHRDPERYPLCQSCAEIRAAMSR